MRTSGLGIEEALRRAVAYGNGGRDDCLHAARPQVCEVEKTIERLRAMALRECS